MSIKSITLVIARYFNPVDENPYFSAQMVVDGDVAFIPYQYGYGAAPDYIAAKMLDSDARSLHDHCSKHGIKLNIFSFNAKKRECIAHGTGA